MANALPDAGGDFDADEPSADDFDAPHEPTELELRIQAALEAYEADRAAGLPPPRTEAAAPTEGFLGASDLLTALVARGGLPPAAGRVSRCWRCGLELGPYVSEARACEGCRLELRDERFAKVVADATEQIPLGLRELSFTGAVLGKRIGGTGVSAPMKDAYKRVRKWKPLRDRSLFLTGKNQVGKTSLAGALCLRVIDDARAAFALDECAPEVALMQSLVFIPSVELGRAEDRSRRGDTPPLIARAKRASLLILDDLGGDDPPATTVVFEVLDHRVLRNLPTFITSNLSLDAVRAAYGERIRARLDTRFEIIDLTK